MFYNKLSLLFHTVVHQARKQRPVSQTLAPEIIAAWGPFLYHGIMLSESGQLRDKAILAILHTSTEELTARACEYLPLLWEELCCHGEYDDDYCDNHEQALMTLFGRYLGDFLLQQEGQFPSAEQAEDIIRTLVSNFYRTRQKSNTFT